MIRDTLGASCISHLHFLEAFPMLTWLLAQNCFEKSLLCLNPSALLKHLVLGMKQPTIVTTSSEISSLWWADGEVSFLIYLFEAHMLAVFW